MTMARMIPTSEHCKVQECGKTLYKNESRLLDQKV